MYYLRARYYDPTTGRFISRDPVRGVLTSPQSQNGYSYAHNDPINLSDPSGKAVPLLVYLAGAWAIAELGLTAADAYDFANTMQDPNANICDKAWSGALFAAGIIGPGGGYGQAAKGIKYGEKIIKQMGTRGWTQEAIETLIKNPAKTIDVTDTRHLPSGTQLNDPATAFINKDGSYVIRNNKTGDVVQVSNRNDPNWKAPWDK